MTTTEIVSVIKDLVTCFATIASAIWIVKTYLDHQEEAQEQRSNQEKRDNQARETQLEKDNKAREFEARKPFNDRQLAVYSDTAEVIGRLATTEDPNGPEWDENIKRFYQLFWAELSMVEDNSVKKAMMTYSSHLQEIIESAPEKRASTESFQKLEQRTYRLASTLRASIESSWDVQLADSSEKSATSSQP
jgi:hypothetical protein